MELHYDWSFRGSTTNQSSLVGVQGQINHGDPSCANKERHRPPDWYQCSSVPSRYREDTTRSCLPKRCRESLRAMSNQPLWYSFRHGHKPNRKPMQLTHVTVVSLLRPSTLGNGTFLFFKPDMSATATRRHDRFLPAFRLGRKRNTTTARRRSKPAICIIGSGVPSAT
jgi:hypothetical protein